MPVTTIDPKPALLVVDLQKGIMGVPAIDPLDGVVQQAAALAGAFRRHGLPVVLVNVAGRAPGRTEAGSPVGSTPPPPDWTEIVAELDPQPEDLRITKTVWGAFTGTTLDAQLRDLGVTQVVVVGVSTSVGVETTARSAYEHGYHVVLATDAMTDTNAETHRNSIERIFPKLGETATTAEVLELLDKSR
ncbi:MAG TPA: isochorismatase family protein [Actinocrinis sp.]|nr:isochorismatase family protein [Actinocrinis sp.]